MSTRKQPCYVCGAPTRYGRVLVDVETAMRAARASRRSIYRWMHAGKVEWATLAGGSHRIYLDSLFHDPPYRRAGEGSAQSGGRSGGESGGAVSTVAVEPASSAASGRREEG